MLSIFDKLLEKIIYKRIYNFLLKNNVLYKHQFGFRTGHSTTLSLIEIVDEIYKNLDDNNYAMGLFLDLQKAFDTVNHSILLDKITFYGIRGIAHDWFTSYLTHRKQFVSVRGICSKSELIKHGVPQGSVLGPLLFLLYINDIANCVPDLKIKLFADDTNIFLFNKKIDILFLEANETLNQFNIWFRANKLSLNTEKTQYMIFKKPRQKLDKNLFPDLKVENKIISHVTSCKYLGVTLDEDLSFIIHIDNILNNR